MWRSVYHPLPWREEERFLLLQVQNGSNIISIAMKLKKLEFQEAKNLLIEKTPDRPIEEELNLSYQLEWCEKMEKLGLNEDLCTKVQIGRPKGKTMFQNTSSSQSSTNKRLRSPISELQKMGQ